MKVHRYMLHVKFHNVLAKHAHQSIQTSGRDVRLALNQGLKEILKREGVKRHRHKITEYKMVVIEEGLTDAT
jgi:hypothetical protein